MRAFSWPGSIRLGRRTPKRGRSSKSAEGSPTQSAFASSAKTAPPRWRCSDGNDQALFFAESGSSLTVRAFTFANPGPSGVFIHTWTVVSSSGNDVSTRVMTPVRPSLSRTGFRDAMRAYMVRTMLIPLVCSTSENFASSWPQPCPFATLDARKGGVIEKLQPVTLGVPSVEAAGPIAMGAGRGIELDSPADEVSRPSVHVFGPAHQKPEVVEPRLLAPLWPGVQG